mmetsp:Transcript_6309/g.13766  ORF Transcript_6309/g.13766 Transcript_6309/m.13766 type:complete len:237 (-) Transcript_6309:153-863(-)
MLRLDRVCESCFGLLVETLGLQTLCVVERCHVDDLARVLLAERCDLFLLFVKLILPVAGALLHLQLVGLQLLKLTPKLELCVFLALEGRKVLCVCFLKRLVLVCQLGLAKPQLLLEAALLRPALRQLLHSRLRIRRGLSVTNVVHVASKISDSAHLADASSHLVDRLVVSLEFGCELAALLLQAPHALLGNDIRAAKLGPLIRKLEHALQGALVPLALLRDLLVDRSALVCRLGSQ